MLDGLPKDLREMDEKQFVEVFNLLREMTKNWTEFPSELFKGNSQFLIIIRCILGLSQRGLAKLLGLHFDTIMKIEAGITKLKLIKKKTKGWLGKLEEMVLKEPPSLECGLKTWRTFQLARDSNNLTSIPQLNKSIADANEKEIKIRLKNLAKKTKNFSKIQPEILFEMPQSILIFRLLFRLPQDQFAKALEVDFSCLNEWETGKTKMRFGTAQKLSDKVVELFEKLKPEISIKNVLTSFKMFRKGGSSRRPLDWLVENGLRSVKGAKLTESEREIIKILKESSIQFERNAIVEGIKKRINVDFAIPRGENPKVVIETFLFGSRRMTFCEFSRRLRLSDQRFQMLKLKDSSIKTIIFPKIALLEDFQRERIEKLSELEVLNTDFILINEKIEELPEIIKKIISN